jgi:hypothetical protein
MSVAIRESLMDHEKEPAMRKMIVMWRILSATDLRWLPKGEGLTIKFQQSGLQQVCYLAHSLSHCVIFNLSNSTT